MKKVVSFVVNSVVLFWGYFLLSFLIMFVLQVPMRVIFDAFSVWEYLWKAIVTYASMVAVCVVKELMDSTNQKRRYLDHLGDGEWSVKDSVLYTVKNPIFWRNTIGFAIWPVLIPRIFGAVTHLYFSEQTMETVPLSLLVIVSIVIPSFICSFLAWPCVLYHWSETRIHKQTNISPIDSESK